MDKKILFEALNTELAKEHISLEIICVGGFGVLQSPRDIRY